MGFTREITESIQQAIAGNQNAKITVGILHDGVVDVKLFGKDGEEPFTKYYYEIGSITKTFTGLLVTKAASEGKLNLEDSIAKFIPELDGSAYYPTVKRLVTHTSGYDIGVNEFDENGLLKPANPYLDIGREDLLAEIIQTKLEDRDYPWSYSNFGAAVVGLVLENVYQTSYDHLVTALLGQLDMNDTFTLNPPRNLCGVTEAGEAGNYWDWKPTSIYSSAGYLVSTVFDMLKYARIQADCSDKFIEDSHISHAFITDQGLRQESGVFWLLFPEVNAIFHNGGTGCFNCSICIDLEEKNAVVFLSNCYTPVNTQVVKWVWNMKKKNAD
jgi:CubicO group peptidase (beta-lactamase class C family)